MTTMGESRWGRVRRQSIYTAAYRRERRHRVGFDAMVFNLFSINLVIARPHSYAGVM